MTRNKTKEPFVRTQAAGAILGAVLGAIITGLFGLWVVKYTYVLKPESVALDSDEHVVYANRYPLDSTDMAINSGDELEIRVLQANTASWACHDGIRTSPIGMVEHDSGSAIYPDENYCALIGRIGNGQHFLVGVYYSAVAEFTGKLYLGANDDPPKNCTLDPDTECFADNSGTLAVKITVKRK